MTRKETEQYAIDTISSGFNCAETLLRTGIRCLHLPEEALSSRIATGFGGGLGRCKEELCGALAGGAMALGLAYGRDAAETPADPAYDAAAEFRERFLALHGATRCEALLTVFGEQDHWEACKRLMGEAAGLLHDMANEDDDTK